jgi:thioredoxin reductase
VEVVVMDEWMDRAEVVVVGGGAAGLSGALMLARSRRAVMVIDAGAPRNARAEGVHGLLARDGTPPGELLAQGRAEVRRYGGVVVNGEVTGATRDGDGFIVALGDGRSVRARRLLVTTGLVDELPDVAGVAERWGRDVLHCPYCHGWEVRDQAVGILGSSPLAVHAALMWRQWSADVTLFQHTAPAPGDEQREELAARGIALVEGEVTALEIAELAMDGYVMGSHIPADPAGATAVPGVWVAGNVADIRATVIGSAAAGVNAAVAINMDLITEDTANAVKSHRAALI